ncbi:MAG TPA: hypothetical protein PLQ56_02175 [Aggregatilineales bacterium]|nr:hypothetical protein [Anaerolineae bacterium]HUN05374.1 hypothetical protein [Aggregatilineales bacterium]
MIVTGTNPPVRLLSTFSEAFPESDLTWVVNPPGYAVWAAAATSGRLEYTLALADADSKVTFSLQTARVGQTILKRPLPRWSRYPAGSLLLLDSIGAEIEALNILLLVDEPAGPRFDYALGTAVAALWHEVARRSYAPATLIEVVDRTRREYASVTFP